MAYPSDEALPGFPIQRPRRLRQHPLIRELIRETNLTAGDFILPLFVRPGRGIAYVTEAPAERWSPLAERVAEALCSPS